MPRRFIMLPADWYGDAQIISVSAAARALFIGMVSMCFVQQSGGLLTVQQLSVCCPVTVHLRRLLQALLDSGLVTTGPSPDSYRITDGQRWGLTETTSGQSADHQNVESPGQEATVAHNATSDGPSRAAARVKKEREKERENQPNPSGFGSVGSLSPAAPRVAGGATQPAKKSATVSAVYDEDDDAEIPEDLQHLTGAALAKEIARRGSARNKYATGRPTQLWKYESSGKPIATNYDLPAEALPGRDWQ